MEWDFFFFFFFLVCERKRSGSWGSCGGVVVWQMGKGEVLDLDEMFQLEPSVAWPRHCGQTFIHYTPYPFDVSACPAAQLPISHQSSSEMLI
jgi:hypothetical protein